ncbi:MAG TPA: hypothetical protein VN512_03550 [Clostridia bacterium]|nr:hypothetical protein [Clostridia bacterium]
MLVEEANGYLDRFILGSSYSGFKLEYSDENDEYKGYILKSLPPLPSGGGPDYPSRALTDLPTGITVSGNIDGGAALTITELRSGSSAALDAMR